MFSLLALTLALAINGSSAGSVIIVDCSNDKDKTSAECICRLPKNWHEEICQGPKWFGNGQLRPRIINGEVVEPNVYNWFARATEQGSWGGCGGSLVTPEYVLTAAHCVQGAIDNLENNGGYQIGALCAPYGPSNGNNCGQKVESFGIRKITQHPNYNGSTVNNDFALVRLDGVSSISPVQMDTGNISPGYEDVSSKTNLWPIGFGTTETGGFSSKLLHVNVNYVKQDTCNSAAMYGGVISDNMMCASDTNQDSCQGDSGGPLFDSDNKALVGVTSWGYGCADAQFPGVYARISDQFPWIKEVICASHGSPKPSFCGDNPPPPSPGPPAPPTPTPPSPSPPSCVNDPIDWNDIDGVEYNCDWYGEGDNCAIHGDYFENDEFENETANKACCACGGGSSTGPSPGPPSPGPGPGPSPCPAGEKLFEIEVITDEWGKQDNKFRVQEKIGNKFKNFWAENDFENDTVHSFQKCLSANDTCYKFLMIDAAGDGLCCEEGEGGYKLTWGGEVIRDSKFRNGTKQRTKFNC